MAKRKKMMEEYRTMKIDELKNKINEVEADLFNMKFNLSTGQLDNTAKIDLARRQIARMKTILSQRAVQTSSAK